jgi:hypothetical protein
LEISEDKFLVLESEQTAPRTYPEKGASNSQYSYEERRSVKNRQIG